MKINFKNLYIFGVSCIVFFIGYLISFSIFDFNNRIANRYTIILTYFVLLSLVKLKSVSKQKYGIVFLLVWWLLVLSIILSVVINDDYAHLLDSLILFVTMPILYGNKCIVLKSRYILFAALISSLPFLKVLGPTNSIGINFCMIGIVSINLLLSNSKNKEIMILATIIVFSSIIYITQSRTALITFFIVSTINIVHIFRGKIQTKKILLIVCIFIGAIIVVNTMHDNFIHLFSHKWGGNDVSSGRITIWKGTIENGMTLFGLGENYFLYNFGKADSHNMFIEALGRYGLVTSILFIIICILIFSNIKKVKYKIEYINFFLGYFCIGMFEDILFIDTRMVTISILFFLYVRMLMYEVNILKINKKSDKENKGVINMRYRNGTVTALK